MPKAKKTEAKEVIEEQAGAEEQPAIEAKLESPAPSKAESSKAKKPKSKESTSEKAEAAAATKQRDPLARRGKAYRKSVGLIDRERRYELAEAIELAKKTSAVKFDAGVDLHVNLGVDPAQSDQVVRTSVVLPGGSAKIPKVAVIKPGAEGEKAIAGIEKGKIDFDVLVTTPEMMPKLAKAAKILGPKGLMPNPKSGTVTADPAKAVKEIQSGKVELRIDKQGIVHQSVGKVSFDDKKLADNIKAAVTALQAAKPSAAKGTYILGVSLATSMGPSVKLDTQKLLADLHK